MRGVRREGAGLAGVALGRLEERTAARVPAESEPRDEVEWLAVFEQFDRDGYMGTEPDFPKALTEMRETLARAQASVDPPFDPPPSFMPGHPNPRLRTRCWRSARFPELNAVMDWMFEMVGRVVESEPPVSEAEFVELAAWFVAYDAELSKIEPVEAKDGHRVWCADVRYSLNHGPRAIGAGRVAEEIRLLKARYTELPSSRGPFICASDTRST